MKLRLLTFLIVLCSCYSRGQNYFQNITGGYLGDNTAFAASPTAYFVIHNAAQPSFIPELIKLDLNGNYLWSKTLTYSATPVSGIFRIRFDNNSLLVTGEENNVTGYNNFLSRLDTSGNIQWSTLCNYTEINTNTRIHPVTGGYLLVGHRDYLGTALDYTYDITITKLDATGGFQWGKAYGTDTADFLASASAIATNGDLLVAGNYGHRNSGKFLPLLARFDSSGGLLWMKILNDQSDTTLTYRINDITATSDGNFAITGNSIDTLHNNDIVVLKSDNNGVILWSRKLSVAGWQEYGKSVIEDSQHNIVLSGPFTHSPDYGDYVAKLTLNGTFLGSFKIPGTSDNIYYFNSIFSGNGQDLIERAGGIYAISTAYKTVNIAYRHYILTTNSSGTISCSGTNTSYPLNSVTKNWNSIPLSGLAAPLTDITGSSAVFSRINKQDSVITICVPSGIEEAGLNANTINVYPNPATEKINIRISEPVDRKMELELFDMVGSKVDEKELITDLHSESVSELEVSALPKGIYILKVIGEHGQASKKILIQ